MISKNQNEPKDFQVSLLIDNIAEAKEISAAFREIGIYAHFYRSLAEYWVDINSRTPDMTIIDVKKMSDGEMLFQNHPKVKKGLLSYAFYYSDETRMLLNSTYNLNHYGFIRKEISLAGQIQSVLRQKNKEIRLIEQNIDLAKSVEAAKNKTQKLAKEASKSHEYEDQVSLMTEFFNHLGHAENTKIFIKNLSSTLNTWEHCFSFGGYTLSKNGQKLTTLPENGPKHRSLPDLWLNTPCKNGIEGYAKEMAEDVSRDYLLNSIRSIEVKGRHKASDIIILANFDEKRLNAFDWSLFSERLSNLYRECLLNEQFKEESSKELTTPEAYSYLDDLYFHQAMPNHKVLNLDLTPFMNFIKEKHGNRFYWKNFFTDFKQELVESLSGNYKYSSVATDSVIVFIDKKKLDQDFQTLQYFIKEFPYFKYFEDTTIIMQPEYTPVLRPVAPSSINYLRQRSTELPSVNNRGNQRETSASPVFNV